MRSVGHGDALWRLAEDRRANVVRRVLARLVWHYEEAPLRAVLIGPEAVYLLDDIALIGLRAVLRPPVLDGGTLSRREAAPSSSGWKGNLIFVSVWALGLASVAIMFRAWT